MSQFLWTCAHGELRAGDAMQLYDSASLRSENIIAKMQ